MGMWSSLDLWSCRVWNSEGRKEERDEDVWVLDNASAHQSWPRLSVSHSPGHAAKSMILR
jgi:hypothetical protein